jgi:hypothetical protein
MRKTVFVTLAMALVPFCGFAVDGVVLINQSTVMAAGGYPYLISQPGSYKLSGNLVVGAGLNGIEISASNVFLDLNGFNISCGGATPTHRVACISGIAAVHDISIRNGSISENTPSSETFTFNGIFFSIPGSLPDPVGERISLQDLMIDSTEAYSDGVVLGPGCIVRHNLIHHPYIFGPAIVLENVFKAGYFMPVAPPDPSNIVIPSEAI